jgi:hypothetical protein
MVDFYERRRLLINVPGSDFTSLLTTSLLVAPIVVFTYFFGVFPFIEMGDDFVIVPPTFS